MSSGIPVRIVGSDINGQEQLIGDFPAGVVIRGMVLTDVITQHPIANMKKAPGKHPQIHLDALVWEVPHLDQYFQYLFIQVMPEDGSDVIDLPGVGKREFF